ncbi:putative Type 1 protein exporter [Helianthus annuus]|nr:putative Type 1 protein exporter [Helianthus annuus]KAJ0529067.1 putative Type 1 protein exporter [Helianthus annuus]
MKVISFSQHGPCAIKCDVFLEILTPFFVLKGRFEILSLVGSFIPSESGGIRNKSGGMSVSLSSPNGHAVGDSVAGLLVAASPVQNYLYMEVGWFDKPENSSGAIGARLSANAASVRGLVGDALAQIVQDLSSAIRGLFIAFTACWQLTFIILAMIPLASINGYVQMRFMKGFSADAKLMYEEASQVANDAVEVYVQYCLFAQKRKLCNCIEVNARVRKRPGLNKG